MNEKMIKEIKEESYNKGLNDAWELVEKLWYESDKILGYVNLNQVLKDYTPQEALAKLKAYEDSKIEVGDVITIDEDRVIVTKVIKGEPCTTIYGIEDNGCSICYSDRQFKKTGKHIDIKSILDSIGE